MLKIDLEPGESVSIGDVAVITLEEKSGGRARIAFKADRSVPIRRVAASEPSAHPAAKFGLGEVLPA